MEEAIEGKVAAIINDRTIVINCGKKDGVEENMRFSIFKVGEELIDPVTCKSMGNLEIVKAKVRIIHIQEKMSSCLREEEEKERLPIWSAVTESELWKDIKVGDHVREYDCSYECFLERLNEKQGSHLKQIPF